MMHRFLLTLLLAMTAGLVPPVASAVELPTNYFGESAALLDVQDPVADDRGPGYYTYPLDKRIKRGTFDLKRFTVYEEDDMIVFTMQMREYIKTSWESGSRGSGEEQGFVANAFDIYIDIDRKRGSGWNKALPGRDLLFADGMGWEKMIIVTPLSQFRAYDIIKNKTEEIGFQDMVPDIIIPDYVEVQRDKIILRISKSLLGVKPASEWGFQCFVLGYSNVVSPNRLLNMDVKAFATPKDFGGGWDTYGDPPVIDMIVPGDIEDADRRQYELLKAYRSEPYRGEIEYAMIPFVYGREKPATTPGETPKQSTKLLTLPPAVLAQPVEDQPPSLILPSDVSPAAAKPPVAAPGARTGRSLTGATSTGVKKAATGTVSDSADAGFMPLGKAGSSNTGTKSGFLPIRKAVSGTGTTNPGSTATASDSFQPLKKKSGATTGFMPIRKATPSVGD